MNGFIAPSAFLSWLAAAFLMLTTAMQPAWSVTIEPVRMTGTVSPSDWEAYRARFVEDNGRIVDNANGNISHSEGQGYGLLLAYAAGDRRTFEKIWTFTLTEFLIRDDGLSVWKWDPSARPRISDPNNATDGDILIAYALAKAGADWRNPRYSAAAQKLAKAIGKNTIGRNGSSALLLPAAKGFGSDDRPDGPVVNLSYWIFEAFPTLAMLAPEYEWADVARTGLSLLQQATSGRANLPADWLSVSNRLKSSLRRAFLPNLVTTR